ncbi:Calx-beta domain-containing protein [Planctomyces sp. SH-PL62]|uniref:Calx-beta domain-containing protein n=1 Tax=Planctomyces sp. SH-PL62 TaxID=1636152 RepID=UPI00078C3179|nr:Calx-beta domain-containing protein [Planctomyces sp. SH-PL62]AMV35853.1 Calx-beta domain protein [Planctomyces sp. SH-PL62]
MLRTQGRARRRAPRTLALDSLEDRRMMSGPGTLGAEPPAIVSLIEFDTATARVVAEGAGRVQLTAIRTGDLSSPATVRARTVAGTALPGYDYAALTTTLTFAAGESKATFTVTIGDDSIAEALFKSFRVVLEDPQGGAGLGAVSIATVNIKDDEPASLEPLTLLDFGASGLWTFTTSEGFRKILDADPQAVVASSNRMAYIDLGVRGLWQWDALRGSRRITDADPQNMVVVNDDWNRSEDVLLADFGSGGLWRWSESRGWSRLSEVDPRAITVDRQAAYIDFGHGGLWRYGDALPWYKLNDLAPESMAAADGVLFLDYGASGTWSWAANQNWKKLGDSNPQGLAAAAGVLYADMGPTGLWSWTGNVGWRKLTDADPRSMRIGGDKLFVEFGEFGLWSWSAKSQFVRLSSTAVDSFVPSLGGDRLLVDQGAAGLWLWTSAGYRRLNAANPDSVAVTG